MKNKKHFSLKNLHSHILLYLHRKNSINLIASFTLCLICILLSLKALNSSSQSAEAMQKDISSEIIRFHVIANSDSAADQALKLKVKSAVTQDLYPVLSSTKDIEAARNIIEKQLPKIEELAEEVIENNGCHYTVKASLEKGYFPIKVYGDLTLPPGQYEALRIEIGKAQGQNWWCIMFPPLCFVDATYSVVPKDSKKQLKHVLTEEEYNSVFSYKKADIKIKCKLFDTLKDCFSKKS